MHDYTWEQAVQWLRRQPDQEALVRGCYYDDPLLAAAQRFADSEEWQAVKIFLPGSGGQALDLGAGRGISSYALARDGWQVTALEPDPSPLVGAAAIKTLAQETGLPIRVVEDYGEMLPFDDCTFDLVYGVRCCIMPAICLHSVEKLLGCLDLAGGSLRLGSMLSADLKI